MCWSWEVSLAFVLFQAVSLTYLFRRNTYIDRLYVMICLPFMGQEICQFFEWAWGDIENATSTTCTPFNRTWSKLLILVAYSIPLVVAIFAFATSQYTKENNKKLSFLWKYLLILDCTLFPILCILMMIDNECITVGEYGHQKWPPLLTPKIVEDFSEYFTFFLIGIYYYPSIVLVGIFYQPLWIAIFPALYSVVSIVIMRALLGEQGWSVWCWSCACITLWGLAYVPISNWMIHKYKNNIHPNNQVVIDTLFGETCFYRLFFNKTHEHFVRFGMLEEPQENNEDNDEKPSKVNIEIDEI